MSVAQVCEFSGVTFHVQCCPASKLATALMLHFGNARSSTVFRLPVECQYLLLIGLISIVAILQPVYSMRRRGVAQFYFAALMPTG